MLMWLRPQVWAAWVSDLSFDLEDTVLSALGPGVVFSDLLRALWKKRDWRLFGPCGISQEHLEVGQDMGSTLFQGNMRPSPLLSPSMVDPDARHLLIFVSPMGAGGSGDGTGWGEAKCCGATQPDGTPVSLGSIRHVLSLDE